MAWLRRENKKTACTCKDILDGFWVTYLSYRSEPVPTREIDKQATEKKAGRTIAGVCKFLDQNFAVFKECSCPTARLLRMIYRLPVIQESNPKKPVSFEEFRPFIKILLKGEKCTNELGTEEE